MHPTRGSRVRFPLSRGSWETTEAVAKACSTHQSTAPGVLFILFLQSFAGPRGGARTKIVLREYRGVPGTALQAGVGLGSSPTLTKWSFEPDTATGGARRRSILKKEGRGVEYSSESLNISSIEQGNAFNTEEGRTRRRSTSSAASHRGVYEYLQVCPFGQKTQRFEFVSARQSGPPSRLVREPGGKIPTHPANKFRRRTHRKNSDWKKTQYTTLEFEFEGGSWSIWWSSYAISVASDRQTSPI